MHWPILSQGFVRRSIPLLAAELAWALGCSPTPVPLTPADVPPPDIAQLWSAPRDLATRDLFHGPGGPALMPVSDSPFTFLAKDTKGFSPGYDVRDGRGMKWSAKYGPEAQSEVVASRITWAMGYHQPPMYYVERWQLMGGDISPDAAPRARFRPELPRWHRRQPWSWARNPFVATQPYRGLIVLMHILSNWDLLDRNTARYDVDEPVQGARTLYVVIDLGAALGKAKPPLTSGTRNDIEDFERQGFIKEVDKDGFVRFDDTRWRHERLYERLTPADVRWTCERLDRLSRQQWSDAFRAGGYDGPLADRFIRRIQEKVRLGLALGGPTSVPARLSVSLSRP